MRVLTKIADNRQNDSLATRMRRERFSLFLSLIESLPRPLTILDVGGTEGFWETMGFADEHETKIVLFNILEASVSHPNFTSINGDARDMVQFKDSEFDVVFSNSVIEHVGGYEDQRRMAGEVMRVGRLYFVQTPNRFFPIEPHFLFPFFQFLPLRVKVFLITRFNMGWHKRVPDKREAVEVARSVSLLTEREMRGLFPNATIRKEKLLGLTKSFMAYGRSIAPSGTDDNSAVSGKEHASARRQ